MSGVREEPVGRIAPAASMADAAAQAVIAALGADGAQVRFVGGCVRDTLRGAPVSDIDLATPDPPEAVLALLARAAIKGVPTGIDHGTVTAVVEGRPFEVTTLRLDVATDGRYAEVTFTDDWRADAARRDFSFNAMSLSPRGDLYDYFGGREDLAAGRVRFVGDAAQRIAEDYLRVLRFFRFLARFGHGEPDAEALAACAAAADKLDRLSIERVRMELLKLLAAPAPVPALQAMADLGVLAAVLPEAGPLTTLLVLCGIDDRDPVRRLAALIGTGGEAVGRRLKMANAEIARLARLAPPACPLEAAMSVAAQRQVLHDLGPGLFRDLVLLAWAGDRQGRASAWRAMLETANGWEAPRLPIRGADITAMGVPGGPQVGRILAGVEGWWRMRDFRPGRPACLEVARALASGEEIATDPDQ